MDHNVSSDQERGKTSTPSSSPRTRSPGWIVAGRGRRGKVGPSEEEPVDRGNVMGTCWAPGLIKVFCPKVVVPLAKICKSRFLSARLAWYTATGKTYGDPDFPQPPDIPHSTVDYGASESLSGSGGGHEVSPQGIWTVRRARDEDDAVLGCIVDL